MGNPSAIVTSTLPPERLNQIATSKLASLGVRVRLDVESQTLRGELRFDKTRLTRPGSTDPLRASNFSVVGHDHLQFLVPPLSALGRILFYDAPSLHALEERVAAALQQRLSSLATHRDRFKRLKVPTRFETGALLVIGQVKTVSNLFELSGDASQVWVSRVTPTGGRAVVSSEPFHFVDLLGFEQLIDLELHLAHAAATLLQGASAGRAAAPKPTVAGAPAVLEPLPAPGGATTLGALAQHLGPTAAMGVARPSEITQDFKFNGATYRFSATHLTGTTFGASLSGPHGEKWSDKFDLLRFPGIASVVGTVLGLSSAVREPPATAPDGPSPFPAHLEPQPGEVWVMNVLVEREDAGEIRYACTNVDGKPFGATRILKRAEFEEVFVQSGAGWRLLIVTEEIRPDYSVAYRQLDRNRQPRGQQKRMEGAILVTTFIPEAMAY